MAGKRKRRGTGSRAAARSEPDPQAAGDARERILEAACYEFSRSGFGGTTMRQIAERADVAHPLINYYFGDKDGLWRAAAERLYGAVGRMLDESETTTAGLDDESRIRAILVDFVLLASESRLLSFLVETSEEGDERTQWLWEEWVEPAQRRIIAIIVEAQERGWIEKLNPELVYQLLTGYSLSEGTRSLFLRHERRRGSPRARAEEFVDYLMRGVG